MQKLREAIRTRGFWTSNVLWFFAGLYFTGLLPRQQTEGPELSALLQRILIAVILLPIYFSGVFQMAKWIDRLIDFVVQFFKK